MFYLELSSSFDSVPYTALKITGISRFSSFNRLLPMNQSVLSEIDITFEKHLPTIGIRAAVSVVFAHSSIKMWEKWFASKSLSLKRPLIKFAAVDKVQITTLNWYM